MISIKDACKNTALTYRYDESQQLRVTSEWHRGAAAVDQLISLVDRNETGIPEHPITLTLKGTWNMGRTLRNAAGMTEHASGRSG